MIKYNGQTYKPSGIASVKYNGQIYYRSSRLPGGYQEVEYIGCICSNGNRPIINTYINPTDTTRVILKWAVNHDSSNYIFGYRNASNVQVLTISGSSSGGTIFANANGTSAAAATNGTNWSRTNGSWNIYSTDLSLANGSATATFTDHVNNRTCEKTFSYSPMGTQTSSLYLFYNGRNDCLFGNRIYSCQLIQAGTTVRNLVPARRESDGQAGMYDLVTNTFFSNVGTGEFTAGPDVS